MGPMPDVDQLVRTAQFGARPAGLPPPAARPPAPVQAMGGRPGAAPPPPVPPAAAPAPPGLDAVLALLGSIGAAPSAARVPTAPPAPAAEPGAERAIFITKLIGKALADPESESKSLFISAATLEALGVTPATVLVAAGRLSLHVALNFDGQGGVLLGRSPKVLEDAERLRKQGEPVPIIAVKGPAARRAAPIQAQDEQSGTAVRPLAPAVEEARRERARQHLREARTARGHINYPE